MEVKMLCNLVEVFNLLRFTSSLQSFALKTLKKRFLKGKVCCWLFFNMACACQGKGGRHYSGKNVRHDLLNFAIDASTLTPCNISTMIHNTFSTAAATCFVVIATTIWKKRGDFKTQFCDWFFKLSHISLPASFLSVACPCWLCTAKLVCRQTVCS